MINNGAPSTTHFHILKKKTTSVFGFEKWCRNTARDCARALSVHLHMWQLNVLPLTKRKCMCNVPVNAISKIFCLIKNRTKIKRRHNKRPSKCRKALSEKRNTHCSKVLLWLIHYVYHHLLENEIFQNDHNKLLLHSKIYIFIYFIWVNYFIRKQLLPGQYHDGVSQIQALGLNKEICII